MSESPFYNVGMKIQEEKNMVPDHIPDHEHKVDYGFDKTTAQLEPTLVDKKPSFLERWFPMFFGKSRVALVIQQRKEIDSLLKTLEEMNEFRDREDYKRFLEDEERIHNEIKYAVNRLTINNYFEDESNVYRAAGVVRETLDNLLTDFLRKDDVVNLSNHIEEDEEADEPFQVNPNYYAAQVKEMIKQLNEFNRITNEKEAFALLNVIQLAITDYGKRLVENKEENK